MAAYATSLLSPGLGASSLVSTNLSGWVQGFLRRPEPGREQTGQDGVIDVRARRVQLEDVGAQRTDYVRLDAGLGGILQPIVERAGHNIDIEKELRREPFMYERAGLGRGFVLKPAPMIRGIFVNTQA